jgi:hypothetical protein
LYFLPAYALFYNVSIVVVFSPEVYLEIKPETASKTIYVYRGNHKNYGVKNNIECNDSSLVENALRIESWNKTLRPITHYKVEDLINMLVLLKVSVPNSIKKAELYDLLLKTLNSIVDGTVDGTVAGTA